MTIDPSDLDNIVAELSDRDKQDATNLLDRGTLEVRRSTNKNDRETAFEWARSTLSLNHALVSAGQVKEHAAVIREVDLAVALARSFGLKEISEVIDVEGLSQRAMSAISISYDEAVAVLPNWRSLELPQIRQLRFAKNILSSLEYWEELSPCLSRSEEWQRWKSIRNQLP